MQQPSDLMTLCDVPCASARSASCSVDALRSCHRSAMQLILSCLRAFFTSPSHHGSSGLVSQGLRCFCITVCPASFRDALSCHCCVFDVASQLTPLPALVLPADAAGQPAFQSCNHAPRCRSSSTPCDGPRARDVPNADLLPRCAQVSFVVHAYLLYWASYIGAMLHVGIPDGTVSQSAVTNVISGRPTLSGSAVRCSRVHWQAAALARGMGPSVQVMSACFINGGGVDIATARQSPSVGNTACDCTGRLGCRRRRTSLYPICTSDARLVELSLDVRLTHNVLLSPAPSPKRRCARRRPRWCLTCFWRWLAP